MSALPFVSLQGSGVRATAGTGDGRSAAPQGPFAPTVPENTVDPFIMTYNNSTAFRGLWHDADAERMTEEVRKVDPDMYNEQALMGFAGPPHETGLAKSERTILEYARRHEMATSGGIHSDLGPDGVQDAWYRHLPDAEKWRHPDGSIVDHPEELAGQYFDGGRWGREPTPDEPERVLFPSIFADGTLDFFVRRGRQITDLGFNQLWMDGFGFGAVPGRDFSPWAVAAFRDHLQSLSDDRLDTLGIRDPASFDLRPYLDAQRLTPRDTDEPAVDPVFREFTLFQHRANKAFHEQWFERSRDDADPVVLDAGVSDLGIQFGLQTRHLSATAIYVSDVVDELTLEITPPIPPKRMWDLSVKIARAAGRFEKNVRVFGRVWREQPEAQAFDLESYHPTFITFQIAQTYAHGGVHNLHLNGGPGERFEDSVDTMMRRDGTIADELHGVVDFVRAHRRFLTEVEEANRTAVVVSLPTTLWERNPNWDTPRTHRDAIEGTGIALRRERVPCDVILFDHPDVWAGPDQLDRLQAYDTVVLPDVECVSDDHVTAIEAALESGTTVIATGGAPSRTADFVPRDDVRERLERDENAVVLPESVDDEAAGSGATALQNALAERPDRVELDPDGALSLNVFHQPDSDRVVVHLLDYAYDPATDSVPDRGSFEVTVRDLPITPDSATYFTPDGRTPLETDRDGADLTVTIPELDVWGFIVIGESDASLEPNQDESAAREAVDAAGDALQQVDDGGRSIHRATVAAKVDNAAAMLAFESYGEAVRIAEEAIDWARKTYRPPTIGFDRAHGQPESQGSWTEYDEFGDTFADHEIRAVETWSAETFDDLDILVVPPALGFRDQRHDFTAEELELAESFVDDGGCVFVPVTAGVAPDMAELTELFGFRFDGAEVGSPSGEPVIVPTERSPLTTGLPTLNDPATVVADAGDAWVFARIADDSNAWINYEGHIEERLDGDEPAAGSPVGVATTLGDGAVVGLGSLSHSLRTGDTIAENVISVLGRHARSARQSPIDVDWVSTPEETAGTTTDTAQPETDAPTAGETADSTPGLGVTTALAGLAGSAYLLARRREDPTDR